MQMQTSPTHVRRFDLDVRLADGSEWIYDYRARADGICAHVTVRDGTGESTREDKAGDAVAGTLLSDVAPFPKMSQTELLRGFCAALNVGQDAIDHLEVGVEFDDGTRIEAEVGE